MIGAYKTVKEKIVCDAIAIIVKRLEVIESKINMRPASEIIACREKAAAIVNAHPKDYKTISMLIAPLAEKEEEMFELIKEQEGSKLWDEKLRLSNELSDLRNELFYISKGR